MNKTGIFQLPISADLGLGVGDVSATSATISSMATTSTASSAIGDVIYVRIEAQVAVAGRRKWERSIKMDLGKARTRRLAPGDPSIKAIYEAEVNLYGTMSEPQ